MVSVKVGAAVKRSWWGGLGVRVLCRYKKGRVGCTQFGHGRSPMTIDPRIPTMPGRRTSDFNQPGTLAPSAKRREVFGESHEG